MTPLQEILISSVNSSAGSSGRYPAEVGGIQVNFCKNPVCGNYGVPPLPTVKSGAAAHGSQQDTYILQSGSRVGAPVIHCRLCGEYPPIKSNAAINEERSRFLVDLAPRPQASCPVESCANRAVPISHGDAYQSFGLTKSGSRRYRCKACRKTFSVGKSTTGHYAQFETMHSYVGMRNAGRC